MKTTTRPIHYAGKMDLAMQIAKTAPVGFTGFQVCRPISKSFTNVVYAHGVGGQYLSVEKLRSELGLGDLKPEPKREQTYLKLDTFRLAYIGKRGVVLKGGDKYFMLKPDEESAYQNKLESLREGR